MPDLLTPGNYRFCPYYQQFINNIFRLDITGKWDTNFGKMELKQVGNTVTGSYEWDKGRIEDGVLSGNTLTGYWAEAPTYNPPNDKGPFEFTFDTSGNSFTGKWNYGEQWPYFSWSGKRIP